MPDDLNPFFATDGVTDVLASYVNSLIASNLRAELTNVETLAANKTLTDANVPIQNLTASGADRSVFLPPEASTNHQTVFRNAGSAFSILIKDDSGALTFATLFPGDVVTIVPVAGTTWCAVGGVPGSGFGMNFPPGTLRNGRIVPSVSSNNLTVAIKTAAGNDPSSGEPAWVKIGNIERKITAALSVTINAATNSFNAGSAELATKEIDYFVYLCYKVSTGSVVLLVSRIPYGAVYSDFSASATNEKYAAASSAPASTDECQVVGRFAATLSAGAGYTWSVPTFTPVNLVLRPIYETRWLDFNFASSNITIGNGTTNVSRYRIKGNRVDFYNKWTLGTTSTIPTSPVFTAPFSPSTNQQTYDGPIGGARYNDTGTANYLGAIILAGAAIQPVAYTVGGTYAGMTGLTAAVPHAWANTDVMEHLGSYEI